MHVYCRYHSPSNGWLYIKKNLSRAKKCTCQFLVRNCCKKNLTFMTIPDLMSILVEPMHRARRDILYRAALSITMNFCFLKFATGSLADPAMRSTTRMYCLYSWTLVFMVYLPPTYHLDISLGRSYATLQLPDRPQHSCR